MLYTTGDVIKGDKAERLNNIIFLYTWSFVKVYTCHERAVFFISSQVVILFKASGCSSVDPEKMWQQRKKKVFLFR